MNGGRIVFTVSNDLSYDQRMQRICQTMAQAGYAVTLVGRVLPQSKPVFFETFQAHRLRCFFHKGPAFYAELNIRLFFYLLKTPFDAVCSIDLDTLPAGCFASILKRKKRVFDAHEYFTEVPEVVNRPLVRAFWSIVARICLPFYKNAYTVSPGLAEIFTKKYRFPFSIIRNMPWARGQASLPPAKLEKIILYQGALNEGRGIEPLLEAMTGLTGVQLWIAGEGDLSESLRARMHQLGVGDKVRFLGWVKPADLPDLTAQAWLGVNLIEAKGLSYYYSLANKFFDYVQEGIPVLTVDFPEYKALNAEHEVAILLPSLHPQIIAKAIQNLQQNPIEYGAFQENCRRAALDWTWEKEQQKLLEFWNQRV